jgi:hypothetical protein
MLPTIATKLARIASKPISLSEMPAAYNDLLAGQSTSLKTIVQPMR